MKSAVAKLEMSGKEAKAVEILENEWQNALEDQKSHESYEIDMLLVEMHIYKVLNIMGLFLFCSFFFFCVFY
jgi:hypothetical protein